MFLIQTFVAPSKIHGIGVFSREHVTAGTTMWRFDPPFDQVLQDSDVANLAQPARDYIEMYAYRCLDLDGKLVLSGDNARFLNHSDDPNTQEQPFFSIARKAIAAGEEITCDYGAFCSDWTGLESEMKSLVPIAKKQFAPHRNLYTRLKISENGVGVFAIREIKKGLRLFEGDGGAAVRVPQAVVDEITDQHVRQMYIDFCPKRDGNFVTPAEFNELTMSWYMNHSFHPNVRADESLQFTASRAISVGEELTIDYSSISDHADGEIARWTSCSGE
jgi:uncharacterized protein